MQGLRVMSFERNPDAELKRPTTVKLTPAQKRRAEKRAKELGISTHAFYVHAILVACDKQAPAQSG